MAPKIALDLTALRRSPDFRGVAIAQIVSGLGTQAALVAVPTQIYGLTHSAGLVGLTGAAELVPMVIVSLFGGAAADRVDRRLLLIAAQVATIVAIGTLVAVTLAGSPPVALIFVMGALLGGATSLESLSRNAMVPGMVGEWVRSALAFNFGMAQLTAIIGPALGGLLIAAAASGADPDTGAWAPYVVDGLSCLLTVVIALRIAPQPPHVPEGEHPPVFESIREGLSFVRHNNALLGSFVIDIMAMTFGMPRVLFVVLSLTVYHAGAAGTGFLYASVAVGATVAAFTTGWLESARRLGRIVIVSVLVWGVAIAASGAVGSIVLAALLLAVAGAADSVSAVCRSTINQAVTPDDMRGRMSAVFGLVVAGGARVGDIEAGGVAAVSSAQLSVVSGGLACVVGVGLVMLAFPSLLAYDSADLNPPLGAAAPSGS